MASIPVDDADVLEEIVKDRIYDHSRSEIRWNSRDLCDFTLLARDLEANKKSGYPDDLSRVAAAAEACALREDRLIYFGIKTWAWKGCLPRGRSNKIGRKDWKLGENAFADVAAGIQTLTSQGLYGPFALAVSPDLFLQMQRLQEVPACWKSTGQ